METNRKTVTRFAPSPTGYMHVGGVRTALYAWLWARKQGGTFILRIEDTDKAREIAGSIDHIIESLRWLGIVWDEGPDIGGPHAPYLQSDRLASYKKYAEQLIAAGYAYPDPYTETELAAFREQAVAEKRPFLFRDHRPNTTEAWDGKKPLRFKTPVKAYAWHDVVRGDLSAGVEAVDDFILIKSDGYPTYNFAHIIDDLEMGVTHIMRADEFISSTPKFLALYEALGIERPAFVTLPPILAEGGQKKLGKRDGAKDLLDYRAEGYLPEAMVNFLALLGWNPGHDKEIFTAQELIQEFEIERIQKSGAQMNFEKLDWMNKEHIRKLDPSKRMDYFESFLPAAWKERVGYSRTGMAGADTIITDHIEKFSDLTTLAEKGELDYLFIAPTPDPKMIVWKSLRELDTGAQTTKDNLSAITEAVATLPDGTLTMETVKTVAWPVAEARGRGETLWPTRVALTGLEKSPDPFTVIALLGKEESLKRIKSAISVL